MRHRPTTSVKGEVTFGYSVNQDKSKILQNVQVNVNSRDTEPKPKPSEFSTREIVTEATPSDDGIQVVYGPPKVYEPVATDDKITTELMHIYRDMLISNSGNIMNLIDDSGKIILPHDSLIHVISVLCGVSDDKIKIQYFLDEKVNCCGALATKINPIKEISAIKVNKNGVINDLNLTYNDIYNLIVDKYKISLEKFYLSAGQICQVSPFQ